MKQNVNIDQLKWKIIFPEINYLIKLLSDNDKQKVLKHEWYLLVESTWPTYKYKKPES